LLEGELGSKFAVVSVMDVNGEDTGVVDPVLTRAISASKVYSAALLAVQEIELMSWVFGFRAEGHSGLDAEEVFAPPPEEPSEAVGDSAAADFSSPTKCPPAPNFNSPDGREHVRGSVDINGLDHATLPADPSNGHPKIENGGLKWPDVKVKATIGGMAVQEEGVEALQLSSEVYVKNTELSRAIFGKPGRMKSCYRCKCDRQGFMVCRVRRGHTNPDFIQEALPRSLTPKAKTPAARGIPNGFGAIEKRSVWNPKNDVKETNLEELHVWRTQIKDATLKIMELDEKFKDAEASLRVEESKVIKVEVEEIEEVMEREAAGPVEADDDHEDTCMICGGEGELLMCDGCPKCVHLECIGLTTISEDEDWFCKDCVIRIRNATCIPVPPVQEGQEEAVKMEVD
jgi:ssDNA-binding Zn-finger/Zn-ribbon topoisomerase 1